MSRLYCNLTINRGHNKVLCVSTTLAECGHFSTKYCSSLVMDKLELEKSLTLEYSASIIFLTNKNYNSQRY